MVGQQGESCIVAPLELAANLAIAALAISAIRKRDYPLAASSTAWLLGNVLPPSTLAYMLPPASGAALALYRLTKPTALPLALAPLALASLPATAALIYVGISGAALIYYLAMHTKTITRAQRVAAVIALGDVSGLLGPLAIATYASPWLAVQLQALTTALVAILVSELAAEPSPAP